MKLNLVCNGCSTLMRINTTLDTTDSYDIHCPICGEKNNTSHVVPLDMLDIVDILLNKGYPILATIKNTNGILINGSVNVNWTEIYDRNIFKQFCISKEGENVFIFDERLTDGGDEDMIRSSLLVLESIVKYLPEAGMPLPVCKLNIKI